MNVVTHMFGSLEQLYEFGTHNAPSTLKAYEINK